MLHFFPAALAVLSMAALATGDYTFQTSPSSGEFLQTSAGLSVRWEMRSGDSPDSPGVATPATVSVALGYKDSTDKPVVLFPPIGDNVPVSGLQFSWSAMDFNSFANGPVPPRDANANWFILLSDQSTGYKSNGQLFHLIDAPSLNPLASSGTASGTAPVARATSETASVASSARLTSSSAMPSAVPSSSTGSPSVKSTSAGTTAGGSSNSSGRPSASNTTSTAATSDGSSVTANSFVLLAAIAGAALLRTC